MNWNEEITFIESIFDQTELVPQIKWGTKVYCLGNAKVVAVGGFKNYVAIWFYKGVFLKDSKNVLINAQEGKTKLLRQWRLTSLDELDSNLLVQYINEAIEVERQGLTLERLEVKLLESTLFNSYMTNDQILAKAFKALPPYKQKEYIEHFEQAKQEKTKISRIEKAIPLILEAKGLNDKYKK
ncbi:YdeI/OmpD-associated family protein [Myroides marinus]|uniref:YdeI/OmpD-associated family protein n=1 Tax=Myroides marinus TaxID=703342 RepID=UPI0025781DF5|nr:DUF1801 domain-containing protein [Myroides marinus]MDM1388751.1 YdeI/OmpD-associated family protein [Myroides marinus]